MNPVHLSDVMPLTCSREGTCCRAALIHITPWEVAVLARATGHSPRSFRDRHTVQGGTVLRFGTDLDGAGGRHCDLYRDGTGCTVHPARPLACRLYPLGRSRKNGASAYHHPGRTKSCADLCPDSQVLPRMSVGDYLAGQQVEAGEAAHDAYAGFLAAMIATAGEISRRMGAQRKDEAVLDRLAGWMGSTAEDRVLDLPAACLDLLIIPELGGLVDDPQGFVTGHRKILAGAIAGGLGLPTLDETVDALLGMAFHLAPVLGTDPELVAQVFCECAGLIDAWRVRLARSA
jgi:Fe-S-cluster containining protein